MIPAAADRHLSKNREEWLGNVAAKLRPWFRKRGYEIPPNVHLGVGSMTKVRKKAGVTWTTPDKDGYFHVTLSPFIDDPVEVAATLAHELIHTMFPRAGHTGDFRVAALALGFLPPMTTTPPGDDLRAHLEYVVGCVGPYPHRAVVLSPSPPKPGSKPTDWKFFCPGCNSAIHISTGRKVIKAQYALFESWFRSPPGCRNAKCELVRQPMLIQGERDNEALAFEDFASTAV